LKGKQKKEQKKSITRDKKEREGKKGSRYIFRE
jgi:hypothetical protein